MFCVPSGWLRNTPEESIKAEEGKGRGSETVVWFLGLHPEELPGRAAPQSSSHLQRVKGAWLLWSKASDMGWGLQVGRNCCVFSSLCLYPTLGAWKIWASLYYLRGRTAMEL